MMEIMGPSLRRALALVLLLSWCPLVGGAQEAESPAEASDDPRIERILELRAELERLLANLPPELRGEVERRWRQRLARLPPPPATSRAPAPGSVAKGEPESALEEETAASAPAALEAVESSPAPEAPATEAKAPEISPPAAPRPTFPAPKRRPVRYEEQGCDTLEAFDGDGDDFLTAADRYWRHFYLLLDGKSGEIESLFELGIRQVAIRLGSYTTDKGARGSIDVARTVRFELVGKAQKRALRGDLMIDADGLARGGELFLVDGGGATVEGHQALRPDLRLESSGGESRRLLCSR